MKKSLNSLKTLTGILLAASAIGCATPPQTGVRVLCLSEPKYASIYSLKGDYLGVCPTWIYYTGVTDEDRIKGYKIDEGIKARWISGAERVYSSVNLPINNTDRQIVFQRPSDEPRLELDVAYELQKDRLEIEKNRTKLMQEQTDNQSNANQWNNINSTMNLINLLGPAYQNTYGQ